MWLFVAGATLVVVAGTLYVTGARRAVGVVLFVIGAVALAAAVAVRIRGTWPGRAWVVVVAVHFALVGLCGVALWIYAVSAPNVLV